MHRLEQNQTEQQRIGQMKLVKKQKENRTLQNVT